MSTVRRVVSHPLQEVVEGMQSRILNRSYPVNSRLPSEADLQQEWGVSRSVVREAMKMLASKGLVRIEQGRGTFVNPTDTAPLRQQLEWVLLRDGFDPIDQLAGESLDQWDALLDVRTVLEVAVAERAAQQVQDAATLAEMLDAIAAMRAHADDGVACSEDDFAFHVALARATRNPLYPALLGSLYDLLRRYMVASYAGRDSALAGANEHETILKAVEARDAVGATRAMRFHLRSSQADLALARQRDAAASEGTN